MDPKKCASCKRTMQWVLQNLNTRLVPIAVKVIVDDENHFHLN